MKEGYTPDVNRRIVVVAVFVGLAMAAILAKAIILQVFERDRLASYAQRGVKKAHVLKGRRGTVYDARYRQLALSTDATAIGAHPGQIVKPVSTARQLSKILRLDRRQLARDLKSKRSFVYIKRQASPNEVSAIRALRLPGLKYEAESNRHYPMKTLAGQAIGFTGVDGQGLEGVEFYYNQQLSGGHGQFAVFKDALGRRFDPQTVSAADMTGNNLVLTLDANIQYIAERELKDAVKEFSAKSGMAIVMNPNNGVLLAMAHYPSFNPNAFRRYRRQDWRNRIITDVFEPGSTLKVFTAAAALEGKSGSAYTRFNCERGRYRIGRNVIHDTHPHGALTIEEIVQVSSNIGAAKLVETMGAKYFYQTLRRFGFGQKTGIDSPGETSGRLTHYRHWKPIDAANIGFGQGIAVSAIQIVTAMSAIANDGFLMRPYLVQAVTDQTGRLLQKYEPRRLRRVISSKTAHAVRKMMGAVVHPDGTGRRAALENYTVGGKTGTAQKVGSDGRYSKTLFVSSFIGLAPLHQPQVVALVLLDEPRKKHYGGTVAAPAFKEIMQYTLDYLNVPAAKRPALMTAADVKGSGA